MGSVGDAYDNALCNSFVATRECTLVDRRSFRTAVETRREIFSSVTRLGSANAATSRCWSMVRFTGNTNNRMASPCEVVCPMRATVAPAARVVNPQRPLNRTRPPGQGQILLDHTHLVEIGFRIQHGLLGFLQCDIQPRQDDHGKNDVVVLAANVQVVLVIVADTPDVIGVPVQIGMVNRLHEYTESPRIVASSDRGFPQGYLRREPPFQAMEQSCTSILGDAVGHHRGVVGDRVKQRQDRLDATGKREDASLSAHQEHFAVTWVSAGSTERGDPDVVVPGRDSVGPRCT